ncbi:uncharacterized protein LOC130642175 [Hydractinia symbiolongicarpus]|uniref:uncharacterized protein LOC130642175 n=1 Tax=Hydractinia symbiolongicarpus TaxID=13093 RepID=UPI00254C6D27|nr:uncharacterized protein LOC130642175 [Hydractinia symbiolongicarpus]
MSCQKFELLLSWVGGSLFFSCSIVLLAVCNAKYEFILVDIGEAGRKSDSGIYKNSPLGQAIDENLLGFSEEVLISGYNSDILFLYIFVADEGFAIKENMMRPYARGNIFDKSEFVFNYRLSRARRVIENSFDILATRFRIFRSPIITHVETVKSVTRACDALHYVSFSRFSSAWYEIF